MTDILEDRIRLLEKEIQEKDRLIASLERYSLFSLVYGSYMHEMKNRIGYLSVLLISHLEICREKGIDKYDTEITRTIEGLRNILDTMGDTFVARGSENKSSIEECIQAAIKLVDPQLEGSRIDLKSELGTSSGNIRVPKREFTSVLLVLLINAIDALKELVNRQRVIQIKTTSENKSMRVTIKDNGNGIDNSLITQIWEPGFSTGGGKSGLGMTWAKMFVVELLGGQISVENELGEFTKVNIIIPEEQGYRYENTFMD